MLQLECIKVLGQDNVGFICLFGVLGLLVTSSVRVTADLGTGLINGVIYGIIVIIAVIPGRPPQNSRGIWEQVQRHPPPPQGNTSEMWQTLENERPCRTKVRHVSWRGQVVVPFWFNGWLVALADILAGCFVLTSLARQDVKNTSAKLIAVSVASVLSGAVPAEQISGHMHVIGSAAAMPKLTYTSAELLGILSTARAGVPHPMETAECLSSH